VSVIDTEFANSNEIFVDSYYLRRQIKMALVPRNPRNSNDLLLNSLTESVCQRISFKFRKIEKELNFVLKIVKC
jgi:hypothetical protein